MRAHAAASSPPAPTVRRRAPSHTGRFGLVQLCCHSTPVTLLPSLPPCAARQILKAAATAKAETPQEEGRAGVCRDPDEEFMAAANTSWFGARKANPQDPRTSYERWLRGARGTCAGDPPLDASKPPRDTSKTPL